MKLYLQRYKIKKLYFNYIFKSINTALGEEKLQNLINFCLNYLSSILLPVKRGNFIELRKVTFFFIYIII